MWEKEMNCEEKENISSYRSNASWDGDKSERTKCF